MKLTRIRLEQFRRFRRPLELAGLQPGINLFTGPNEAGKSTIVAAIRAAFFERHRSGAVEDLRPWDEPSAAPTVELDFEIDGRPYRLKKSFLARKRCELLAGAQRYEGAQAEDHLAELLGFQYPGKGNSKAEHWGIPGLLWMQQGAGHEIREPVAHATDRLRAVLVDAVGEVTASGGDEILAAVQAERNELLTPATGQPRGAYAQALKRQSELSERAKALHEAIVRYREQVDELQALRAEHARDEREAPWQALRSQAAQAQARLDGIVRLEDELAQARARLTQIEENLAMLLGQLADYDAQQADAQRRMRDCDDAQARAQAAAAQVHDWTQRRDDALARYELARAALQSARQRQARQEAARRCDELRARLQAADAALADAEAASAALQAQRQRAAANEIAEADLQRLRELRRRLDELTIRRDAAATRLHYVLDDGRSIDVAGQPVAGSGQRLLLADTEIAMPGLGKLRIQPGGSDLAQVSRDAEAVREQYDAVLGQLGVPDLAQAEVRWQAFQQAQAEARASAASLGALAPHGIDALRADRAALAARLEEAEAALGQAGTAPEGDEAETSIAVVQAAEEAAAESLRQAEQALAQAQQAQVAALTASEAARRELAALQALLALPERAERQALAQQRLVEARAEQATVQGRIKDLLAQIEAARPDILRQDVERYTRSAEQHERRHAERRERIARLEAALQADGAQGLDERHAECRRDAEQAARRVRELRRRAAALDYLYGLLRDRRRSATLKLQAPLARHLNRYLQLLFAQASLELGEDLAPSVLMRDRGGQIETGGFEALSFGAREQMALICRLAYADLLKEAGRPTLVILDDALAHSDDLRLAQMKRALFDAGSRHQVLLFTCHPDKWGDLGVAPRSLPGTGAAGDPL